MTAPVVPEAMKYVGEDPDKEGRHLWRDENMAKVYRHAGAVKGLSPNDTKGEPETEKGNDYHDGIFSFKYKKGTGNATQEHKKKADKPGSVQGQLIQRLLQQYGQNRCWFDAPAVEIDALERVQYVLLPGTVKARETGEPLATSVEAMRTELAKVDQFIKKFGSRDESGELKPADPRDGVPYAEVITRGRANELREAVDLVARGEYDAPLLSRFQPRDETQIVAVDTQVADDSLCQALMNRERQPADLSPEEVEQLVQELMKRNGKHEQAMTMLEQKMEERCVQVRRDALATNAVGAENNRLNTRDIHQQKQIIDLENKLYAAEEAIENPDRARWVPREEYANLNYAASNLKARLKFDRDISGPAIAAAAKEKAKQMILDRKEKLEEDSDDKAQIRTILKEFPENGNSWDKMVHGADYRLQYMPGEVWKRAATPILQSKFERAKRDVHEYKNSRYLGLTPAPDGQIRGLLPHEYIAAPPSISYFFPELFLRERNGRASPAGRERTDGRYLVKYSTWEAFVQAEWEDWSKWSLRLEYEELELELLTRLESESQFDLERLFEQSMRLKHGTEWRCFTGHKLSFGHPNDAGFWVPELSDYLRDPIKLLRHAMEAHPPPDALHQFVGDKYPEFGWTSPPPTLLEIHKGAMNDTTARHVLYADAYKFGVAEGADEKKRLNSSRSYTPNWYNEEDFDRWQRKIDSRVQDRRNSILALSAEELKKSYHMMMKEWHTDKNQDSPWAEEMSRLLNAVKTWLDNLPKKRPRDDPGCSSDEVVMTESVADVADPRSMAPDV